MQGLVPGPGWTVPTGDVKTAPELKRFVLESPDSGARWRELGF